MQRKEACTVLPSAFVCIFMSREGIYGSLHLCVCVRVCLCINMSVASSVCVCVVCMFCVSAVSRCQKSKQFSSGLQINQLRGNTKSH